VRRRLRALPAAILVATAWTHASCITALQPVNTESNAAPIGPMLDSVIGTMTVGAQMQAVDFNETNCIPSMATCTQTLVHDGITLAVSYSLAPSILTVEKTGLTPGVDVSAAITVSLLFSYVNLTALLPPPPTPLLWRILNRGGVGVLASSQAECQLPPTAIPQESETLVPCPNDTMGRTFPWSTSLDFSFPMGQEAHAVTIFERLPDRPASQCANPGDCGDGQACVNGACVDMALGSACNRSRDCPEPTLCSGVCTDRGAGVVGMPCLDHFDCDVGLDCQRGYCIAGCFSDSQCGPGEVCANTVCVPDTPAPECTRDDQCISPQRCAGGACADCITSRDCASGEQCDVVPAVAACIAGLPCSQDVPLTCPVGFVCCGGSAAAPGECVPAGSGLACAGRGDCGADEFCCHDPVPSVCRGLSGS
jgi:hypothetical protein